MRHFNSRLRGIRNVSCIGPHNEDPAIPGKHPIAGIAGPQDLRKGALAVLECLVV
ncbi:MAG: hypothetical protein H6Q05_2332 [Acidobacteria bacterium]|nr:hypothetical protein [Acidobacteriota bacterium]